MSKTITRRVVVTGLGVVSPLATGVTETWKRLINGDSALRSLNNLDSFKTLKHPLPSKVGAPVERGFLPHQFNFCNYNYPGERNLPDFIQFGIAASHEAILDAGWSNPTQSQKLRTGVCVGSGIGSVEEIASTSKLFLEGGIKKVSPFFVPKILVNLVAGHISIKHGFQGPNHSVSTACATGAHAIGDAMRFIQYGDADVMVAGSSEASLTPFGLVGFCRAKSLSTKFNDDPVAASRPFDSQRDGFVMGEGAGIMILEELEHAKKRGAKIYAEIKGYGLSGDAFHYTSPPDDGNGAARAMQRALDIAEASPKDVRYINCHATSTPQGDRAENRAIKTVFADCLDEISVSSTKGAIGHLLGAAGAVESIFTVLSLFHKVMPPTLNLEKVDDEVEFSLDYVRLKSKAMKFSETGDNFAMSNSFGFGGTNCSLCFSAYKK